MHLEQAARQGHPKAVAALEPRDYPEEIGYLHQWSIELHGRSGVGMAGFAPLTYTTIRDWAALTKRSPTRADVEALLQLDMVMLFPEPDDSGDDDGSD